MLPPRDGGIGIEVEMEGIGVRFDPPAGWSLHNDGSLRGEESAEYIFSKPLDRASAEAKLDTLYATFSKRSKINPSDRCGVHIHLNMQKEEIEDIWKFIILYLIFEEPIVAWCGENRSGNMFCLRACDAEWLMMSLIKDRGNGNFNATGGSRDEFKYASINVGALLKYGSLEFRAMYTPKGPKPIKDWLRILLGLKEVSAKVKNPIEFIERCSADGADVWAKNLLDDFTYAAISKYPDLEFSIFDSIRRVQPLVYTELGDQKKSDKKFIDEEGFREILNVDWVRNRRRPGIARFDRHGNIIAD